MKLTNEYMNKGDKTKAMKEKKKIIVEAGMSIPDEKLDVVAGGLQFPVIEEDITDLSTLPLNWPIIEEDIDWSELL